MSVMPEGGAVENRPKVLVCQRGARHRYAIPRMFEQAGMLAGLYTDSTCLSPAGRLARVMNRLGLANARLKSLVARNPAGIPRGKVFSSDSLLLAPMMSWQEEPDLRRDYMRQGLRGANVVYSIYGEEFGFLEWAKAQGARIMVDVIIHPLTDRIVAAERVKCGLDAGEDREALDGMDRHSRRVFSLADSILCPSAWVAEGVRAVTPECDDKVRVVPYGSSLEINAAINAEPEIGRILFVGRDVLRKGLHYLAEAAHRIRKSGLNIEIRAAGVHRSDIDWMPHRNEIHCLGTLPMSQMRKEYEQADLFVLPSLSEGQAGVLLEAMACGCPVIATRESGVDFEPGCGLSIPSCDAGSLADAIVEVLQKRSVRNDLARGALRQAEGYSMANWRQRLVETTCEILDS